MEFRALAHFVTACRQLNLTKAAEQAGIATSSLSNTVKALEGVVGIRLFDRTSKGLAPTAAGLWLCRESLQVLHTESFLRSYAKSGTAALKIIPIHIDLEFSIGQISSAVFRSIELVHRKFPDTFFRVHWSEDAPGPETAASAERPAAGRIDLRYLEPELDIPPGDIRGIATERLVLVRLKMPSSPAVPIARGQDSEIVVPRLPRPLQLRLEQFTRDGRAIDLGDLLFTEEDAGAIRRLLPDHPETSYLLPSSAIAHQSVLSKVSISELDESLSIPIVAVIDGKDAAAKAFATQLRQCLAKAGVDRPYEPELTLRQVNYFDLLRQSGSVTKAAKLAAVAQPAVTEQLNKLEAAVGGKLFVRSRQGLHLTAEGARFAQVNELLLSLLDDLKLKRPRAADLTGGRVDLGVLPSVGPEGYLISRITKAVEAWRVRHPDMRLRIFEEPNSLLRERISLGTLDLGIVTTESTRTARFDLGSSEELALIANATQNVLPDKGPVGIEQLAHLPLILPTTDFGIRQRIDAACHRHGIVAKPVIEVDSLSMCVALIRESALCTILPPSELTREIESGEFVYRFLSPKLVRTVQIIYSAKRALTQAERELIELLRAALRASNQPRP